MIAFLIANRHVFIALSVVALLLSSYYWAKSKGRAECKAEYEIALQEAQNNAQKAIKDMERGYANASKKIRQVPSGGCVGDASRASSEWLRSNYTGE